VKQLTLPRLRQMALALDLSLDDESLTRLRPMVNDLISVARRLRSYPPDIGRPDPSASPTTPAG
jgi:hypothetical protein